MAKYFTKVGAKAFWRLLRPRTSSGSEMLCSRSFYLLPPEMIQHIASFLPASSAAALALCNHDLSGALGEHQWNLLRSDPDERALFLQCLERDLPEHLFCDCCAKLHLHRGPGVFIRRHQCSNTDGIDGTTQYYHPQFRFEHVQMAMKLHRSGRDTKGYLAQLAPVDTTIRGTYNIYLFEARIVAHEFFVRIQHWLFIPGNKAVRVPKYVFRVCHHLTTDDFQSPTKPANKLISTLSCRIAHLNDKQEQTSCERCSGLSRCDYCPTDFRVDFKSFAGRGTAIIVTKWMNLGAGRARSDPKWRTHLRNIDDSMVLKEMFCSDPARQLSALRRFHSESDGPFEFEAGSICAAFERNTDFTFDSLVTPKHISKLLAGGRHH
jgi:hypothetical protein